MMQTFKMTDVGEKTTTHRIACAVGQIHMNEEAFNLIKQNRLPKGSAFAMAETAGILAAKKTSEILPLCHPLALEKIEFQFELDEPEHAIQVLCTVSAHERTGVEMEALMGVQVALLTIYDLTKPINPALIMTNIHLKSKQGGKKGIWTYPKGEWGDKSLPHFKNGPSYKNVRAAVLTISDRASRGEYQDEAGEVIKQILKDWGAHIAESAVVPDEKEEISNKLLYYVDAKKVTLIMTTGGTGISKRDHTPEVVASSCERMLPGFGELLRYNGSVFTPYAWLSRSIAGVRNNTLIITLPGNPNAVRQGLEALKIPLLHAIGQLGT